VKRTSVRDLREEDLPPRDRPGQEERHRPLRKLEETRSAPTTARGAGSGERANAREGPAEDRRRQGLRVDVLLEVVAEAPDSKRIHRGPVRRDVPAAEVGSIRAIRASTRARQFPDGLSSRRSAAAVPARRRRRRGDAEDQEHDAEPLPPENLSVSFSTRPVHSYGLSRSLLEEELLQGPPAVSGQLGERPGGERPAAVDDGDPVDELFQSPRDVAGDEDREGRGSSARLADQLAHLADARRVEARSSARRVSGRPGRRGAPGRCRSAAASRGSRSARGRPGARSSGRGRREGRFAPPPRLRASARSVSRFSCPVRNR